MPKHSEQIFSEGKQTKQNQSYTELFGATAVSQILMQSPRAMTFRTASK